MEVEMRRNGKGLGRSGEIARGCVFVSRAWVERGEAGETGIGVTTHERECAAVLVLLLLES